MLLTLMLCHVAWAVRALPVRKTVTMPDGTQAEVILKGDEHFHFYQTLDGRRGQLTADGRFKLYTKTEFDAVFFERHVERINVYSASSIGICLKCGVELKEVI